MVWGSSQAGGPCLPSLSSPLSCRAPLRSGGPIPPVITDLLHEKTPRSVGGHEGQRTDSGESLRAREVRGFEPRPHRGTPWWPCQQAGAGDLIIRTDCPTNGPTARSTTPWEYQPLGVSTTDRSPCGAAHKLAVLGQDTAGVLGSRRGQTDGSQVPPRCPGQVPQACGQRRRGSGLWLILPVLDTPRGQSICRTIRPDDEIARTRLLTRQPRCSTVGSWLESSYFPSAQALP